MGSLFIGDKGIFSAIFRTYIFAFRKYAFYLYLYQS